MLVSYHSNDTCGTSLSSMISSNPNAWFMGYVLYNQFTE